MALTALLAHSCFLYESHLIIDLYGKNDSDHDVWFSYIDNRQYNVHREHSFYDAGITMENYEKYFCFVKRDTTKLIFIKRGIKWEELFPDSLRIRVWRDDAIRDLGWDRFLRENGKISNMYEVEYVLSVNDFDQLNYTIPYPPDDNLLRVMKLQ